MYRRLSLILLIIFLGCEGVLEIELEPPEKEIAVTGVFTENTPWQVVLQRTVGIQEASSESSVIDDAIVTIDGSNGSFVQLDHKGGGFYYSDASLPVAGVSYTLQVEAEGYRRVQATDEVPGPAKVQEVRRINEQSRFEITLDDTPGVTNHYAVFVLSPNLQRVRFNVLNTELDDQMRMFAIQDPFSPYVDRPQVAVALIHDKPFDGEPFDLILSPGDKISGTTSVYVHSISKAYYDYLLSKSIQENAEDLAFAEPAPLTSNIQGGQGFFAGYSLYADGDLSPQNIQDKMIGTYSQSSYGQYPENLSVKPPLIEFTLHPDHSVTGRMEIQPSGENEEVAVLPLNGAYTLRYTFAIRGGLDYFVQLYHDEDTFFRNTVLNLYVRGTSRPFSEQDTYLSSYQEGRDKDGNYARISRSFTRSDD